MIYCSQHSVQFSFSMIISVLGEKKTSLMEKVVATLICGYKDEI